MEHKMLIKVGNRVVNLNQFAGFELDDENLCLWLYLLPTESCEPEDLKYTGFRCETQHEYDDLKQHVDSIVYAGEITSSDEYKPAAKDYEELLVESLPKTAVPAGNAVTESVKPPIPPQTNTIPTIKAKTPFSKPAPRVTTTRPPFRKFGK